MRKVPLEYSRTCETKTKKKTVQEGWNYAAVSSKIKVAA